MPGAAGTGWAVGEAAGCLAAGAWACCKLLGVPLPLHCTGNSQFDAGQQDGAIGQKCLAGGNLLLLCAAKPLSHPACKSTINTWLLSGCLRRPSASTFQSTVAILRPSVARLLSAAAAMTVEQVGNAQDVQHCSGGQGQAPWLPEPAHRCRHLINGLK